MKKFILVLAAALTAGITPVLARGIEKDPRAEKSFSRQFAGAENVKWIELESGYHGVIFTLNGVKAEAYYDQDAELIGTVRNLFFNQLPLLVMQTVSNKFTKAAIVEVREITNTDGTQYKVLLEDKGKVFDVRLNSVGSVLAKTRLKK